MRARARIAAWLVGPVAAAALVWAVAPALSVDRYVPKPVNFEQALPGAEKLSADRAVRLRAAKGAPAGEEGSDEGRVRYLTEPFAAPKRFDLVGFLEDARPLELRARAAGEEWSPWVETSDGEPIWTGGADELQVRSRRGRPRGEIAYVNVSGTASKADRALNGVRGAVNSAIVSVGSLLAPGDAGAQPPFEVVNRVEWDPREDCKARTPVFGEVRGAVIHHTVNANTYTAEQAPAVVLAICRYHRYSRGWNDIGYNGLVDRFGNFYAGRSGGLANAVVGAHTAGFNAQTVGVASVGTHTTNGLGKPAFRALVRFLAWKLPLHGVDAKGKARYVSAGGGGSKYARGVRVKTPQIARHRRFNQTSCPGKAQVKKILKRTRKLIEAGGAPPPPPPPPDGGGIGPG
jgi:hypothetical protein